MKYFLEQKAKISELPKMKYIEINSERKNKMRANEYQVAAMRTANELSDDDLVLNGALGLAGESGEVADHLKKHLFQGHKLDKKHVAMELGDVCWYIAIAAKGLGYTLEEIMQMNVNKLTARYPNGFDSDKSINRK